MLWGCNNPRSGVLSPDSRSEMDELADKVIPERDKYFVLADKISLLLEESMAMSDDKLAMEHIREFTSDNDIALERLRKQFDSWFKRMSEEDIGDFQARFLKRKASGQLRTRIPAFRNRIKGNSAHLRDFERLLDYIEFRK